MAEQGRTDEGIAQMRDALAAMRSRGQEIGRPADSRAEFTQPERRIVSMEWKGSELEVLTTSQKLAHRVASELGKAFGGRATFEWSHDDGSLLAIWEKAGSGHG